MTRIALALLAILWAPGCGRSGPAGTEAVPVVVLVDAGGRTSISGRETIPLAVGIAVQNAALAPGAVVRLSSAAGLLSDDDTGAARSVTYVWDGGIELGRPRLTPDLLADGATIQLTADIDGVPVRVIGDATFVVEGAVDLVDIDGEQLLVEDGWTVGLYHDFSAEFLFDPQDFPESQTYEQDNEPLAMLIPDAPFPPSIVLAAGRRLLEISHADRSLAVHDYTPAQPNSGGPDYIADISFSPLGFAGAPSIVVASSSTSGGDGTFEVDTAWNMRREDSANNTRRVIADPAGIFDGSGTPEHYIARGMQTLRSSDAEVIATGQLYSSRLQANGDLLLVTTDWTSWEMTRLQSVSLTPTTLVTETTRVTIPRVSPHGVDPPDFLVLRSNARLEVFLPFGQSTPVAESLDPDWRWVDAFVAMPGSQLAGVRPAVYVLEGNRTLDRDRILRFEMR